MALAGDSSASDQLAFDMQEDTDATIYNLQFRHGQTVKTIWSRRVELISRKKPHDWCNLFKWEQNEHGILALVETSAVTGKLLQFGSNGDLIAEIEIGHSFLRDGGSQVKLEPPDKIESASPDGNITKFVIRDGQLADENGRIFERPQLIQIGKPTSEVPAHKQDAIDTAALSSGVQPSAPSSMPEAVSKSTDQNDETTLSTPRWLVAVLIVAALGLLWVWLKKRK